MVDPLDTILITCSNHSFTIRQIYNTMLNIGTLQEETFVFPVLYKVSKYLDRISQGTLPTGTDYAVLYINSIQGYIVSFSKGCSNMLYSLSSLQVFELLKHLEKAF